MPKKTCKTAKIPSSHTFWSQVWALGSLRRSPHSSPSAPVGQSRHQQEAEERPPPHEPYVANPTPSAGETTGKGPATAIHKVRPHAATCTADFHRFHQAPGRVQPVLIVFPSSHTFWSQVWALGSHRHSPHSSPSASVGQSRRQQEAEEPPSPHEPYVANPIPSAGETTGKGPATAIHEVRPHAATCTADFHRFHQAPGGIQPLPTVLDTTQDRRMDSTPGPAKIPADALGFVDTLTSQWDAINTGYRQTLSTFSTAVNGITGVRLPNGRCSSLTDAHT